MRNKCLVFSSAVFLVTSFLFMTNPGFGASFQLDREEEFRKTLPLIKGGAFSLKNVNGNITIETWNREEVDIRAEKAVRGPRENLDRIKIEIEAGRTSVVVDTVYPKIPGFRGRVNYEIKVPEGADLEKISTVNGNVYIFGSLSGVEARSTNGSVEVKGASGEISCSTTNGNINASDIRGEIIARSTNGSIRLEVISIVDEITAATTNGSITLEIGSADLDAYLDARTTNGRLYVDFPVTLQEGWSSKRMVKGTIGEGGPLITLKTTNGSVKIQK